MMSMLRLPKSFEARGRNQQPPETSRRAPDGITVCPKAVEAIGEQLRKAKEDLLAPEAADGSTK